MLKLADGLTLADVTRTVEAARRFHQPTGRGGKEPATPSINISELRRLPWGSVICGFAIADKLSSGSPTGQICLRFYVRRKVSEARLTPVSRIPRYVEIRKGKELFRLTTDVVVMPQDPMAQRQIEASAAIGSFTGVTDGTLGLAVADDEGQPYALTCSHVIAPWFRKNPMNDPIESPPDKDAQAGPNEIGTVHSWTRLVAGSTHSCDAALVKPKAGVTLSNTPLQLNPEKPFGGFGLGAFAGDPKHHVQVFTRRKVVSGVLSSVRNHFGMTFLGKTFGFRDVVEVNYEENMMDGDSGSVVLQTKTRQVLGIHFAGIDGTGLGYYIPIEAITKAFSSFGLRPL